MREFEFAFAWLRTFVLIGGLLGLIILIIRRRLSEGGKSTFISVFVSILSLLLTLFGIVIAISDDYLSQYDYKPETIEKFEKQRREGVVFDEIIGTKTKNPPEFIFALDISASTSKRNKAVPVTKSIDSIIKNINSFSGRMTTKPYNFNIANNKIPYCELLRVRLLHLLMQMENMGYEKSKIKYSIISFGSQCGRHIPPSNLSLEERIDKSFDYVMGQKFKDENTNFVDLFEFINKKYLISICDTTSSHFDKKDYVVVFLSDYLHDVKNDDLFEAKKKLKSQLNQMENANANFKFYLIMDDEEFSEFNTVRIDRMINSIYEKDNREEKRLHHPTFNTVDLREMENSIDYPIIMSAVLPFFYSNRVFEDSLKTKIVFGKNQKYSFRLGNYSIDNRQEFSLCTKGDSKKYRLSKNKTEIPVRKNDIIEIEIKGFIPSPYRSPDIIIEDPSKGVRYILPVVFYKVFPASCKYLLRMISIVAIAGIIVIVLVFAFSFDRNRKPSGKK